MMSKTLTGSRLLFLVLLLPLGLEAHGSTWYVNGLSGSDSNNCTSTATACKTIGHAITRSSSGDSIIVAAATFKENLSIAFNLTIIGSSAPVTIIDGGAKAAVVTISKAGVHVNLSQLTIRNGSGLTHGGGGIYNAGTLTITNSTVSGNTSNDTKATVGGFGGGIYNSGTLTILQSTLSGNNVTRLNGGAAGGGIYNTGKLTITNSTLSGNLAEDYWPAPGVTYGGGLANVNGAVTINNSTLSKNGALVITPLGNVGTYGGGIYNKGTTLPTLQNSIVANNTWGGDCYGSVTSQGFNMRSDSTCNLSGPGDQKNANPYLGTLGQNGGPTLTMALLPGSPARNAGNPSGCTDGSGRKLTIDQRGHLRPTSAACDMGAYNH